MDKQKLSEKKERQIPTFSIIVTAYDRVEFVKLAVDSVLSQNFSETPTELIVVKNFENKSIDNFLSSKSVKTVKVDEATLGEMTIIGAQESSNNILCFLDDDDIFLPGKLRHIYSLFSDKSDIGYYHNSYSVIDLDGNIRHDIFKHKLRKDYYGLIQDVKELRFLVNAGAQTNMSSICVRKELVMSTETSLRKAEMANDDLLLYSAIENRAKVYIDKKRFSVYRYHRSKTHHPTTFSEFLNFSTKLLSLHICAHKNAIKNVTSPILLKYLSALVLRDESLKMALSKRGTRKELFRSWAEYFKNLSYCLNRTNLVIFVAIWLCFISRRISPYILYLFRKKLFPV